MVDLLAALTGKTETRFDPFGGLNNLFTFDGLAYSGYNLVTTLTGDQEPIESSFGGYVAGALKSSGVVFTVEMIRTMIFSEARTMYRALTKGRPGDLFSTADLEVMRRPGPAATEGDLRTRAMLDADLAGNHFALRKDDRIHRLRPDWMTIILGSETSIDPVDAPDATVVGYMYRPGGHKNEPVFYLPDQVAHWAPMPDPMATYRGMSWMTPVLREIQADKEATAHKDRFFVNGATPNMIVKHQVSDVDQFKKWVDMFRENHEGVANAYKTLHMGAGSDATVVGNNFQQLDFKAVQGAGETRIAAASGVGAVIAQFSEGMAGSSLNAGNYAAARRRVADGLFRPLWRSFAGAYQTIVPASPTSELWYDERDIAFLREDAKDLAEIQRIRAGSIRGLVDSGFMPDSVIKAVNNDDMSHLVHSGLFSVQLQKPGAVAAAPDLEPGDTLEPEPELEEPAS